MKTAKLFLHVGHYKTGTTAIQVFSNKNRAELARLGLDYYDRHIENAKHSVLGFSLLRAAGVNTLMHGYNKDVSPESLWRELFDAARGAGTGKTLVSTEELMRIGEFPAAADRLRAIIEQYGQGLDIRVIIYLRPIGPQVKSWYNQMVKMNQKIGTLEAALSSGSIERIHFDYHRAVKPWIDIFGHDAVMVRRYPGEDAPRTALLDDFFSIFELVQLPDDRTAERDRNTRMDDRLLDAVRLAQNSGMRRYVSKQLRYRVADFVKAQENIEGGPGGIAEAQSRANAGLASLADLVGGDFSDLSLPIEPRPVGPDLEALELQIGFVTAETIRLQQQIDKLSEPKAPPPFQRFIRRVLGR